MDFTSKQHQHIQALFNMWIFHVKATVVDSSRLPIINCSIYHDISPLTTLSWKVEC